MSSSPWFELVGDKYCRAAAGRHHVCTLALFVFTPVDNIIAASTLICSDGLTYPQYSSVHTLVGSQRHL